MDQIEVLRQELADLRKEVKTLKRTRWITPGAAVVALVSLVVAGVAAPRVQDPQTDPGHKPVQLGQDLVCKSLKVVNDAGVELIQLSGDKDGGLAVVNGIDGKKRFFVAVENGGGFSDWYDSAGMRRATVFLGEKGNSEFRLNDKQEKINVLLQQADAGGFLAMKGIADEKNRIAIGVDNGAGYLDVSDAKGILRESFYLNEKDTAQFKVLGADGTARFLLTGNPDGGQAIAYAAEGRQRAVFP